MSVGPSSTGWPYHEQSPDGADPDPIHIPNQRKPSPHSCMRGCRSLVDSSRSRCLARHRKRHTSRIQQWIRRARNLLRKLGLIKNGVLHALILTALTVIGV